MILSELTQTYKRPFSILLVEDEPGDRELFHIAMNEDNSQHDLTMLEDGIEAMKYLERSPPYEGAMRPDIMILDLNIPKKSGLEILAEVKMNILLQDIPVIVLSTSQDNTDVTKSYRLGASAYIVKPGNFRDFRKVVTHLKTYWFETVTLPEFQ